LFLSMTFVAPCYDLSTRAKARENVFCGNAALDVLGLKENIGETSAQLKKIIQISNSLTGRGIPDPIAIP
jgi:hypothetical protein